MNKQSKSKVVKKWKSSKIQVKKDSKGLLWVVLGKEKVKLPKDVVVQTLKLQEAEEILNSNEKQKTKITIFSEDEKEKILNDIFLQIRIKDLSVRRIFSKENPNKPIINRDTFYEWLNNNVDYSDQYARACEKRADNIFDEMLDIADCEDNDIIEDEDGVARANNDVIQRDRLRIDTRKWVLSKMNPKKYGDKTDLTSNGETIQTTARILTKQEAKELFKNLDNDY